MNEEDTPDGEIVLSGGDRQLIETISEEFTQKWQQLIDATAEIFDVPAALIMHADLPYIEVFQTSQNPENPYEVGDREKIVGLYCEEVVRSEEMLHVPNAQESGKWRDNPDVREFGLISYLGFPITLPSGDVFGTICVLDSEERQYTKAYKNILEQFSKMIESDLRAIQYTKQLETQQEKLRRQSDRLESFARMVSHDLRNPLNVAQGRIELAQSESDGEHLTAAAEAIDRSLMLIEDVLELARGGRDVSEKEPVNLAALAEDCWASVESQADELTVDVDTTILADRSRLCQLLENLFRNSVEHGGDTVAVRIGSLTDGFYVEDTGPGIPTANREKVFDEGYSAIEGGTGFGLAIVKQIVDAHGWEIRITTGSEGGARFEITGTEFGAE